jgi:hypothetical protein
MKLYHKNIKAKYQKRLIGKYLNDLFLKEDIPGSEVKNQFIYATFHNGFGESTI